VVAQRSSSDPVSRRLMTGERIVWRHQPDARTLFYNRLPGLVVTVLTATFVVWVCTRLIMRVMPAASPAELDVWIIIPASVVLLSLVVLSLLAHVVWGQVRALIDSDGTHYALTDRRLMVVSARGMIEYDVSYFHKMESVDGAPGRQVLLFDWRRGRRGRYHFRDRIAGLPDAKQLERLIRDTLGA
jgi:hypothetical protein